jgi:hypothetical protein
MWQQMQLMLWMTADVLVKDAADMAVLLNLAVAAGTAALSAPGGWS